MDNKEKFENSKLETINIKGIEVNDDNYNSFVKFNVRVNQGIPLDEIWIYYEDGRKQIFKIV